MTNADYIKSKISDADIALMIMPYVRFDDEKTSLIKKAYKAWQKWAESTSNNKGNMAKGRHGNIIIKEDPSIWYWMMWHYPDGTIRKSGRTPSVSLQVWLSMQYNPEDWR